MLRGFIEPAAFRHQEHDKGRLDPVEALAKASRERA
jgi:hypothetical protein